MKVIIAVAIAAVVALVLMRLARKGGGKDERAHELMEQGGRLLDVRTDREYRAGHLEGALHIPVDQLSSRMEELGSKEKPVVVYCASGTRSARAQRVLEQAGFEVVHNLKSMRYW